MKTVFFILLAGFTFGQTDWYTVPVNTTKKLTTIDFPSEMVGYIAGDSGVMLKTVNGGETWNEVSYSGIQSPSGAIHFSDIDFVDEMNGFVVVRDNSIGPFMTTDGGLTWVEDQPLGNLCYKRCVYPFGTDDWLLAGAGCFQSAIVQRRNSGGWTEASMNYESFNPTEYIAEVDFSGNVGIAAMNAPYLLRTADGGATWDTIPTGIFGVHTSVRFANAQTCYAGYNDNGNGFGILVSTDAGLTWTQDMGSATFFYPAFLSVTSASNGDVYSGAAPSSWPGGLIFELSGGGWTYSNVDQPVNDMASYGTDITFGVGDSGLVVVNTQLSQLSAPEVNTGEMNPFGVYPNPCENVLHIQGLPEESTTIALCDFSGKQIHVYSAGTGPLDVSSLEPGVYFIRAVSTEGIASVRVVKVSQ